MENLIGDGAPAENAMYEGGALCQQFHRLDDVETAIFLHSTQFASVSLSVVGARKMATQLQQREQLHLKVASDVNAESLTRNIYTARDMELLGDNNKRLQNDEHFITAKLDRVSEFYISHDDDQLKIRILADSAKQQNSALGTENLRQNLKPWQSMAPYETTKVRTTDTTGSRGENDMAFRALNSQINGNLLKESLRELTGQNSGRLKGDDVDTEKIGGLDIFAMGKMNT